MITTKGTRKRCPRNLFVPDGWKWCAHHETIHPLTEFYITPRRISSYCQEAARELAIEYYYRKQEAEGRTVQKHVERELTFGQQRRKAYHKRWRMKKRIERNGN